ncbi:hypothetical protein HLB23_16230 [Nocardia uniformis]|uniref:Uncharacterized protein n=1 Tax=Nocardia uniformis TaxID=53432 RepID=A0A849BXV8_9NOCA|nr:hypothetical protein [Nocardia uniformis]NNH71393.1 hypothetical protein [Nocardia uniformis]
MKRTTLLKTAVASAAVATLSIAGAAPAMAGGGLNLGGDASVTVSVPGVDVNTNVGADTSVNKRGAEASTESDLKVGLFK